jgi:hypothetical protein
MPVMAPLLEAMHPMSSDHIREEPELMTPDFASYNFEWLAVSPRWRDHYYTTDQTPQARQRRERHARKTEAGPGGLRRDFRMAPYSHP